MIEKRPSGRQLWWSDVFQHAVGSALGALMAASMLLLGAWVFGLVTDLSVRQIAALLSFAAGTVTLVVSFWMATKQANYYLEQRINREVEKRLFEMGQDAADDLAMMREREERAGVREVDDEERSKA